MKPTLIASILSLALAASGRVCKVSSQSSSNIPSSSPSSPSSTAPFINPTTTISTVPSSTTSSTPSYPKGTGIQLVSSCKNPKHWGVTYDDGPTQYADIMLDLFKKYNIKATFFVTGNLYIKASDPEWSRIIKRMDDEGHIIGNHTFDHIKLGLLSIDEIKNELLLVEDALFDVIGKKPAFMRLPNLSGGNNSTISETLESLGYNAMVNCNVDTKDYANGGDKEYAVSALSEQLGNSIITLNHLEYNNANATNIIELATAEIEYMLANGYKPVTMEECLGISGYQ